MHSQNLASFQHKLLYLSLSRFFFCFFSVHQTAKRTVSTQNGRDLLTHTALSAKPPISREPDPDCTSNVGTLDCGFQDLKSKFSLLNLERRTHLHRLVSAVETAATLLKGSVEESSVTSL